MMRERRLVNLIVEDLTGPVDGSISFLVEARSGRKVEPEELWFANSLAWVRADGSWISTGGWDLGKRMHFRPGWFDRWRIRRAVQNWKGRLG